MIEENVYEKKTQAGEVTAVNASENGDQQGLKNVSTVLGKFKDVDALARAYSALEAEFTRRSQRLKELEKKTDNLERVDTEDLGVEKLRKNAEARREAEKEFDKFLTEVGQGGGNETSKKPEDEDLNARDHEKEGAEAHAEAEESEQVSVEKSTQAKEEAYLPEEAAKLDAEKGSLSVAKEKTELSSDELFKMACENEEVRLKIIGEYLNSLGKTSAPLTTGRGGVLLTPPIKAKNIVDAGDMALRYFKKGLQQE